MKKITSVFMAVGIATWLAPAADVQSNAVAVAPSVGASNNISLNSMERAQYADMIRGELEASTQRKLLTALADEHLKRSLEPQQIVTGGRAEWEAKLAQEFRARSSQILDQLNGFTKQRLDFEAKHGALPAPASGLGHLDEVKPLNPDELTYVSKLDEELLKVRQELVFVDEANKPLYSQLQTNTTAEAVGSLSVLIDLNSTRAKALEREQADIELRKLEFRALRK